MKKLEELMRYCRGENKVGKLTLSNFKTCCKNGKKKTGIGEIIKIWTDIIEESIYSHKQSNHL
jgi:hypothetical protein